MTGFWKVRYTHILYIYDDDGTLGRNTRDFSLTNIVSFRVKHKQEKERSAKLIPILYARVEFNNIRLYTPSDNNDKLIYVV